MMITQLNIDFALKSFLIATQSDSLPAINYPGVWDDFKTRLKDLVTSLGYKGKARFAELSKGELRATVAKKIAKRVVSDEDENDVICSHVDTNGDGTVNSKLVLKLANAPSG